MRLTLNNMCHFDSHQNYKRHSVKMWQITKSHGWTFLDSCLTCTYREGKNVKYGEHCKKRNILEMQFQVKKWILRFPSLAPLLPTQQQKKTKISKKKKLDKIRETNSGQILHFVSRMFILWDFQWKCRAGLQFLSVLYPAFGSFLFCPQRRTCCIRLFKVQFKEEKI